MSTVTVRMKVKPDKLDEFERILQEVTASVHADEPDAIIYATWATETPGEYLMVESYRSEAGRAFHNERQAHHWEPFMACLEEPPVTEVLGALLAAGGRPRD